MARSRGQVASFCAVSETFFALARSFVATSARPASIKYARLPGSRSMAHLASPKALGLVSADCVYAMQRKACAGAKLGCSEITLLQIGDDLRSGFAVVTALAIGNGRFVIVGRGVVGVFRDRQVK